MFRALALLYLASASAIVAAPAPQPKPRETGPWFDGWDEPVDPKKDCRFDRKGGKLTITVPGRGHKLDFAADARGYHLTAASSAPMLVRDVDGDFTAEVRIAGHVAPAPERRGCNTYIAGMVLLDGKTSVKKYVHCPICRGEPMHYRIARRKDTVTVEKSSDGRAWRSDHTRIVLSGAPKKLRLGIVAGSDGDGVFEAEFDRLEITTAGATK